MMKTTTRHFSRMISKFTLILLPAILAAGCSSLAQGGNADADITDNQIRDIVVRVAKHQIHSLADGDYSALRSVEAAQAAKSPDGIAWSYPWGVTLFGMSRSTDVTGDKDVDNFVVQHNLI